MKRIFTAIPFLIASPLAAETLVLSVPMQGGTLQTRDSDVSAYWMDKEGGFEVTAFYVTKAAPEETLRVQMLLSPGDKVSFGLPGDNSTLFTFAADDGSVSISDTPIVRDYAKK